MANLVPTYLNKIGVDICKFSRWRYVIKNIYINIFTEFLLTNQINLKWWYKHIFKLYESLNFNFN